MRTRARLWSSLASGLLAATLLNAPATLAAEPSSDDPATPQGLLETFSVKDLAGVGAFACAEKRETVMGTLDLSAGLTVTIQDLVISVVAHDGSSAILSLAGVMRTTVEDRAARAFVRQPLEAQGVEATDEVLDPPLMLRGLQQDSDLSDDRLGGGGTPSPAPSDRPSASSEPIDPAAYERLRAAIPGPLRAACEPDAYWQVDRPGPDPGEIAQAGLDPDDFGGVYVTSSLFASAAALEAFVASTGPVVP